MLSVRNPGASGSISFGDEGCFKQLFDLSPDPTWIIERNHFVECNEAAIKTLGYPSRDALLNVHPAKLSPPRQPDGEDSFVKAERMMAIAKDSGLHRFEWTHTKANGADFLAEVTLSAIQLSDRQVLYCVWRDITERKKADVLLQASLRLRKYGLDHSLGEVLTQTLDEAELLTGSQIGFFHFLDADQKTLWLQNWSTRTLKDMCRAEGKMQHYSVDQAGVWVDCIRERRPVIHNDYASLPHRKGLPLGHAPVSRELVVPILRGETIVGILGVGNKPTDYDEQDVETTSILANLTWEIVAARRAEQALNQNLKLLAETEKVGKVGGWEFNIDTGKQNWTQEVYRIHEVDFELAPTVEKGISFYSPDSRPMVEEAVRRAVEKGEPFAFDAVIITAKGNRRNVHATGIPDLEHRRIYGFFQDVTERKQLEQQVRQLAFYDVLTTLPNRRLLIDRLDQAMAASRRTGRYGALIFLDLDNFKPLNDRHGHEAGDLLLKEVARRLTSSVREIDTVSRFGGDEFAVLLSDVTADKGGSIKEVVTIAEKIRVKLAEPYLLAIRGEGSTLTSIEHCCSASIGAVMFMNHESSQADILRRADTAMYQAKNAGRNSVVFQAADGEV